VKKHDLNKKPPSRGLLRRWLKTSGASLMSSILRSTRENLRLAEERNIQLEVAMRDVLKALAQYGLTTETYCKPNGWRDLVDAHLVQLNALETRLDRVTAKLRSLENKNREAAEKSKADKLAALRKKQALHERQKLRDVTRLETSRRSSPQICHRSRQRRPTHASRRSTLQ